jgi:hypothetical protein
VSIEIQMAILKTKQQQNTDKTNLLGTKFWCIMSSLTFSAARYTIPHRTTPYLVQILAHEDVECDEGPQQDQGREDQRRVHARDPMVW